MKTLLLTGKEVKPLLSMDEVTQAVKNAFKEKGLGRVNMPPKLYLFYKKYNGDLRCMPSYMEGLNLSAVKVINMHPENTKRFGLRLFVATIILINPENGRPLSIMDGTMITDMRTGAAGGVAAECLARRDSTTVGLVGAGKQARTQLKALMTLYGKLEEVRVYDISKTNVDLFVKEASNLYRDTRIVAAETAEVAVKQADIVVTATPSRQPLVKDGWVSSGTHLNCIGADAPGKQELEPAILKRAKVVVDDMEQAIHSGEINVPISNKLLSKQDIYGEIGEIVAGLKPGRASPREITVFCSTGLAIQDAVTAKLVYDKAVAGGIGTWVEMFNTT